MKTWDTPFHLACQLVHMIIMVGYSARSALEEGLCGIIRECFCGGATFRSLILLFSLFITSGEVAAQEPRLDDIPESFQPAEESWDYQRAEAMIPMRDGVKLYTVILTPRHLPKPMPIMLTRTPYNATTMSRRVPSSHLVSVLPIADELFASAGYIRVFQDVRGKHKSEGAFVMTRPLRGPLNSTATDESTDAWDTIDWLVKNVANNNGRVGIIGTSYEGYLALMALIDPHPALKVSVPVNPMVDGWKGDDWFHNGAFREVEIDYVYRQTTTRRSELPLGHGYYDDYSYFLSDGGIGELGERVGANRLPFWKLLSEHPAYDDFWSLQATDTLLRGRSLKVQTMLVHSLFDQEDSYGAVAAYKAIEEANSGGSNVLVLGPWSHAQSTLNGSELGAFVWDSDTAKHFRSAILQPFLDHVLLDAQGDQSLAPVTAFDTGRHEWTHYDVWPPSCSVGCREESKALYLQPEHRLGFTRPLASDPPYEEYVSDPAKPVPYRVRPIRPIYATGSTWSQWLVDDQRPFSDRTDVLTYTSNELTAPLKVAGEPIATLFASTTGTDADWVVKLIDVFPDESASYPQLGGYELMISAEITRGRYRESLSRPTPVTSNQVFEYRIRMPAVSHTFLPGHRLMVQIQSTWFPLYDRNPQRYIENIFTAKQQDYTKATQRIYQSGAHASWLELPVVSARQH
jgi:uncharacterized protein